MKYSEQIFDLISHAVDAKTRHPEWRWGQSVFNTAYEFYGYNRIDKAPDFVNPFNNDARVDLFLQWLQEELNL